jgi:galactokinase
MQELGVRWKRRIARIRRISRDRGLGARPEIFRAPGRVNLMGDGTDYNDGFVFPAAIDLEIWVAGRASGNRHVEMTSLALGQTRGFDLDRIRLPSEEGRTPSWIDYVAGVAWALQEDGLEPRGFRGLVDSDLPIGAGLSSSAALELASALALLGASQSPLPGERIAKLGRRAENEFVGVKCGIMDQLVGMLGRLGHALLIDCRSLVARPVSLPEHLALVVSDTQVRHELSSSAYNERLAECMRSVALLRTGHPAIRALRDVSTQDFEQWGSELPDSLRRRVRHVVSENSRVVAMAAALDAGDEAVIGRLMSASHASLRDNYEISSPELDAMAEIAWAAKGVVGSRMTGGGFGGCTVTLAHKNSVLRLRETIQSEYKKRTGRQALVQIVESVDGAGSVPTG